MRSELLSRTDSPTRRGRMSIPDETPVKRFLMRSDYNLNNCEQGQLPVQPPGLADRPACVDSSSLGFGNRRPEHHAVNFQNSNYQLLENIRSSIGEWNSVIGTTHVELAHRGIHHQDESRETRGTLFPLVDILEGGPSSLTFGGEPFTPNNELRTARSSSRTTSASS